MTITRPYPYLYRDKDRQGRVRWRLRLPGRRGVTVKGRFGSPEFALAYRNALEGCGPTEKKGLDGPRRVPLRVWREPPFGKCSPCFLP